MSAEQRWQGHCAAYFSSPGVRHREHAGWRACANHLPQAQTNRWRNSVGSLMYIEFHARSAFSFLEGASLPESLIETCANLGMPAMALLDRDGVYGAPRFYMAAKRAGIKAHIGAEINCENFSIRNCQF